MVNRRNYMFKFTCSLFLLLGIRMSNCQESSCSRFFQYRYDDYDNLYGLITVPTPNHHDGVIELGVRLSVGNYVNQQDIQNMKFLGNTEDVVQRRPLVFALEFPPWNTNPPQIASISINKEAVCFEEPIRGYGTTTTVDLIFTLRVPNFGIRNSNRVNRNRNRNNSNNRNHNYNTEPPRQATTRKNPVNPVNTNNNFDDCGKPMTLSTPLIAKGNTVQKGAHPWIGALFLKQTLNPKYLCGATLITNKHALTAGHCVVQYDSSKLYLTFGRIRNKDWLDENTQNAKIKNSVIHPDYSNESSDADIAILSFVNQLIFTATVKPICLRNFDSSPKDIVNKIGVVVGWGKNENDVFPEDLQEIRIRAVSEEDCLWSSNVFNNITSNRTFCAGNMDKSGPCSGDSGSGLYFYMNERWTIRGIVSRSLLNSDKMCDIENFVVYVDVVKYMEWIRRYI